MNLFWGKVISLHVLRYPNDIKAVCGREVGYPRFDNRPAGKTCESCLRWLARQADPDEAEPGVDPLPI